jgi:hypothetical protein
LDHVLRSIPFGLLQPAAAFFLQQPAAEKNCSCSNCSHGQTKANDLNNPSYMAINACIYNLLLRMTQLKVPSTGDERSGTIGDSTTGNSLVAEVLDEIEPRLCSAVQTFKD